jgi:hypothetical protein
MMTNEEFDQLIESIERGDFDKYSMADMAERFNKLVQEGAITKEQNGRLNVAVLKRKQKIEAY